MANYGRLLQLFVFDVVIKFQLLDTQHPNWHDSENREFLRPEEKSPGRFSFQRVFQGKLSVPDVTCRAAIQAGGGPR